MKKVRMTGFFLATIFCAFLGMSCQNDTVTADDGANIRDYSTINKGSSGGSTGGGGGSGAASTLYAKAEGFENGPWGCWDSDGETATTTNGNDGGLRIVPNKRPCGSTYCGVNLAAGTKVGKNADLDGSMFTKVIFKLRGNINASLISFYGLNKDKDKKCGTMTGKDENNNDVYKMLDKYNSDYNAETWTEITIELPNSTKTMSSALTLSIANDPSWSDSKWIEIKDIDWQDANGNSVVPVYIE